MIQNNIIREIVQKYQKTQIEAGQFFISWNGVPTLAYKGFSPVLLDIKEEINSRFSSLCKENSSSQWPKTTLGALNDDKTLSREDLFTLKDICDSIKPIVRNLIIEIDRLSVVVFYCRSLEKRLFTGIIPLSGSRDMTKPPQEHLDLVSGIMKQFSRDNVNNYLPDVQKKQNRISHYQIPFIETSLVFDLDKLPGAITGFCNEVDKRLPGMYCWFDKNSLHMTIRALR